eukprot:3221991-Prymnesium_polylepis.2
MSPACLDAPHRAAGAVAAAAHSTRAPPHLACPGCSAAAPSSWSSPAHAGAQSHAFGWQPADCHAQSPRPRKSGCLPTARCPGRCAPQSAASLRRPAWRCGCTTLPRAQFGTRQCTARG